MNQYILDTNYFSLWQQEYPLIMELVKTNAERVSTTVVTAESLLRGRFHTIRQASQSSQANMLVLAYDKVVGYIRGSQDYRYC